MPSRPQKPETIDKIRAAHLTPEVQKKRFDTAKANGTLGKDH